MNDSLDICAFVSMRLTTWFISWWRCCTWCNYLNCRKVIVSCSKAGCTVCLAKINNAGSRCGWRMPCKTQRKKKLDGFWPSWQSWDIYTSRCRNALISLLHSPPPIAVFGHRQDSVIWKLKNHMREKGRSTQIAFHYCRLPVWKRDRRTETGSGIRALMKPGSWIWIPPTEKEKGGISQLQPPNFNGIRGHILGCAIPTPGQTFYINFTRKASGPVHPFEPCPPESLWAKWGS